jgi:hypothetical protein
LNEKRISLLEDENEDLKNQAVSETKAIQSDASKDLQRL